MGELPGIMGRLLGLFLLLISLAVVVAEQERKLKVLTVATERNAGFLRFERSCVVNGLTCTPLGMGQEWQGGDMNYPGGGWKVNLLKEAMEEIKDEKDSMVMFTNSYDVVISTGKDAILAQYDKMGADILPSVVIVVSCFYICICSKLMYTGEDGHMRIYIMGRAVTGIGEVVVYKPPPRKERKKKEESNGKKPVNV